jgi:hypothetical protein
VLTLSRTTTAAALYKHTEFTAEQLRLIVKKNNPVTGLNRPRGWIEV